MLKNALIVFNLVATIGLSTMAADFSGQTECSNDLRRSTAEFHHLCCKDVGHAVTGNTIVTGLLMGGSVYSYSQNLIGCGDIFCSTLSLLGHSFVAMLTGIALVTNLVGNSYSVQNNLENNLRHKRIRDAMLAASKAVKAEDQEEFESTGEALFLRKLLNSHADKRSDHNMSIFDVSKRLLMAVDAGYLIDARHLNLAGAPKFVGKWVNNSIEYVIGILDPREHQLSGFEAQAEADKNELEKFMTAGLETMKKNN